MKSKTEFYKCDCCNSKWYKKEDSIKCCDVLNDKCCWCNSQMIRDNRGNIICPNEDDEGHCVKHE